MSKESGAQRGSEVTSGLSSGKRITIDLTSDATPEFRMSLAAALIRENEAEGDFYRLVNLGCDSRILLLHLGNLLFDPANLDNSKSLIGFDRKRTQTALDTVRAAAADIDRILGSLMGKAMAYQYGQKFHEYAVLPKKLRLLADYWELMSKWAKRRNLAANTIKQLLVQHVIEKTRRPHDREVSALISAMQRAEFRGGRRPCPGRVQPVLNKPYDEVAHRMWRNKYMRQYRHA
jgi:hypothetical protein